MLTAADLEAITAQAGREYHLSRGKYTNPHPFGTPAFDAFERGWMQALKRDNAQRVVMPIERDAQPTHPASTVNRYELAKGRVRRGP